MIKGGAWGTVTGSAFQEQGETLRQVTKDEPRTTERPNLRELKPSLESTKMSFFIIRMAFMSSKVIRNFCSVEKDR